jgi:hypothetical protein
VTLAQLDYVHSVEVERWWRERESERNVINAHLLPAKRDETLVFYTIFVFSLTHF